MLVTRLDDDRKITREINVIDLEIDGMTYKITEEYGMLRIHSKSSKIHIVPHSANEISIHQT